MSEEQVVAKIKWDKKSKKVGLLLEALADAIDLEAYRRSEALLDDVWQQGYDHALDQVAQFGLPALLAGKAADDE